LDKFNGDFSENGQTLARKNSEEGISRT